MQAKSEDPVEYKVGPDSREDEILQQAREILARRVRQPGAAFNSPTDVRNYLTLALAECPHEEFGVLWLGVRHTLILDDRLFRGTLTQTSVYPREVVKSALACNAAAGILYHNHPSGASEPSQADQMLTNTLKQALGLVDVRVLDHIIVAGVKTTSFAERGLI